VGAVLLSREEYRALAEAIRSVPPESLRDRARYARVPFTFDPRLRRRPRHLPRHGEPKHWDRHIPPDYREYVTWMRAVCARHAEAMKPT
jgi:hypothetical protein